MKPKRLMLIAGEASGDILAAELVEAIRRELAEQQAEATADYQPLRTSLAPRFFGAGGPRMAAAGVELALDLTAHSIIGFSDAFKSYLKFRGFFHRLYALALEREPDAIICVDFAGFNRRFAHAIRSYARAHTGWFQAWQPKLIQYVSPQVWASREGRAYQVARDYDLLLSIFPFEKDWYAKRVPGFHVEFVGHPVMERYEGETSNSRLQTSGVGGGNGAGGVETRLGESPKVLLLPGSRKGELKRHLPVMIRALALVRASLPEVRARMALPNPALVQYAKDFGLPEFLKAQAGELAEALSGADVAIASTGTVTLECARLGVPTVAMYKTSWSTWQIAKRIVKVKYAAMPNLLANEEIQPEFLQTAATPDRIAGAVLALLSDEDRRSAVKSRLSEVVASLGGPGASRRAARAVLRLLDIAR